MASIREVAKLAGVSAATVSRVMNGTANVDEEKRRRVLDAIEKTGFRPNELARALFKKSSRIIGMIVPDIENPFFSELAKAVEETAYLSGYRILFCNSDDDRSCMVDLMTFLLEHHIPLVGIEIVQPTLEDVFLRLTQDGQEGCA